MRERVGLLENKQGTTGSVRVYKYLMDLFGGEITRQAAHFGCAIYAEHTGMAHTQWISCAMCARGMLSPAFLMHD